jgi:hypothetical protein
LGIILGSEDSSSPDACEAKASLPKPTALPLPLNPPFSKEEVNSYIAIAVPIIALKY